MIDALNTGRRKNCFYVECEFVDVYTKQPFFGSKACYTTKREALNDMKDRESRGLKCRVVDYDKRIVLDD